MASFQKAVKYNSRLRLALAGPSGAGKTYSALKIGSGLGQRVALIDTERGSASKYADIFNFDVLELESFHPQEYIKAIHAAEAEGFDVLIIDSLTHAWTGKDGALELVDRAAARSQSKNSYFAWREVTPLHNALVDAMVQCKCHLIVTIRSKVDYIIETNTNGQQVPRRVGMAPIQREGLEYEFDVAGEMDQSNNLVIHKSRCQALNNAVIPKPDEKVAEALTAWLTGAPAPEVPKAPVVRITRQSTPTDNGNGQHITEGQQKRIFPMLREANVSKEHFKAFLLEQYQHEHMADITRTEYDQICTTITTGGLKTWVSMNAEELAEKEPVAAETQQPGDVDAAGFLPRGESAREAV